LSDTPAHDQADERTADLAQLLLDDPRLHELLMRVRELSPKECNTQESGADIRTGQEPLGHSDVSTTLLCAHVLYRPGLAVCSPAET
jgi:hypothetical protein